MFRAQDQDVDWIGLDIGTSQEVRRRSRADARFEVFDGVTIPFADDSFDVVFCKQVLEHVRHPGPLLGEVRRVLAPGGHLAGSTSQLEPYHSLSYWNYTPRGLRRARPGGWSRARRDPPGIDSLGLIARRLVPRGRRTEGVFGRWWGGTSPLNRLIDVYGRRLRTGCTDRQRDQTAVRGTVRFPLLVAVTGRWPEVQGRAGQDSTAGCMHPRPGGRMRPPRVGACADSVYEVIPVN